MVLTGNKEEEGSQTFKHVPWILERVESKDECHQHEKEADDSEANLGSRVI